MIQSIERLQYRAHAVLSVGAARFGNPIPSKGAGHVLLAVSQAVSVLSDPATSGAARFIPGVFLQLVRVRLPGAFAYVRSFPFPGSGPPLGGLCGQPLGAVLRGDAEGRPLDSCRGRVATRDLLPALPSPALFGCLEAENHR